MRRLRAWFVRLLGALRAQRHGKCVIPNPFASPAASGRVKLSRTV